VLCCCCVCLSVCLQSDKKFVVAVSDGEWNLLIELIRSSAASVRPLCHPLSHSTDRLTCAVPYALCVVCVQLLGWQHLLEPQYATSQSDGSAADGSGEATVPDQ
jgi:hypothetical protein